MHPAARRQLRISDFRLRISGPLSLCRAAPARAEAIRARQCAPARKSSIVNRQSSIPPVSPGFSLAEMLVAVAVLMILMAGFTMLFTGSVRTVRSAMQQTDAYDRARGAIASINADLLSAFNSTDTGNQFSFYGTPIGMTFVGLIRNRSDNVAATDTGLGNTDLRLARVTYVLYHDATSFQTFPGGFQNEDGSSSDVYTHRLLRYVEMNAADLDSFPYSLDASAQVEGFTLGDLIEVDWQEFVEEYPGTYSDQFKEDFKRAKKCEIWIRMLAGGDNRVPSAWAAPGVYLKRDDIVSGIGVADFVLTDHIITPVPPGDGISLVYPGYNRAPFSGFALFDYDYARPGDMSNKPLNAWWNDLRSVNCQGGVGFCAQTSLPEVVTASFWLMFEAPYVGAPDFQRQFTTRINIPTGYTRQITISGYVYNSDGPIQNVSILVNPPTDREIVTDSSGAYSVPVIYGWNGTIAPAAGLVEPANPRTYSNVTTAISGQNYEVQ